MLDVLGGLYLAYDLLGGERGPLSKITRIVTYTLIIGLCLIPAMGLRFGLIASSGLGFALGLHLHRIGQGKPDSLKFLMVLATIRAFTLAVAIYSEGLNTFALCIVPLIYLASLAMYWLKLGPSTFYESAKRPSFGIHKLATACALCTTAAVAGCLSTFFGAEHHTLVHTLKMCLTVSFATVVVTTLIPVIEWYADNIQPKMLGYFGTILFLLGFILQAIPSICVLIP